VKAGIHGEVLLTPAFAAIIRMRRAEIIDLAERERRRDSPKLAKNAD
jgi:hypothetical protein